MPRGKNKSHMQVSVRGVVYSSAHEAAEKLGVSLNTVYYAVHKGRADFIGLGRGGSSHKKPFRKTEIVVLGKKFESRCSFSRHVGKHEDYAKRLIHERGLSKAMDVFEQLLLAHEAAADAKEHKRMSREHAVRMAVGIEDYHIMGLARTYIDP